MSEQFIAGHYRILKQLGKGAFGHTYLAEDIHLPDDRLCVVKQLKPQSTDEFTIETAKRLFPREAAILNKLGKHPQIPRLLAHPAEEQEFYLIQEYIEGQDLEEEIKPGKKLEESQVIKILDEMLDILTFVHHKKVIHRDIKPSNVMRQKEDGKLFLIDFGAVKKIATQVSNVQELTVAIGTPGYQPGEQKMGQPRYASDIYALGMMAIFALTGIEPSQLWIDRATGEIQWREGIDINPKLAEILDKMVRQDYRDRYRDATAAHQALKEFLKPVDRPLPPPKPKSSLVKKLLATTALLFTLGGGGYYILQQNKTPLPLTYENVEHGIEIDYPDNWILEAVEDPFGTVARFYPQESQGEKNPVLVTMEVGDIDSNTSLDDYNTAEIGKIIEYLPAAKLIDSRSIELNNIPAHRIVYTGQKKDSDTTTKYLQVWFMEADKVFVLTYVAPEDKYQEFSGNNLRHTFIKRNQPVLACFIRPFDSSLLQ